jgi:hypothetical protein
MEAGEEKKAGTSLLLGAWSRGCIHHRVWYSIQETDIVTTAERYNHAPKRKK